MTDVDARRAQLRARRSELLARLGRIEDLLDDAPDPDWNDNAIEMQDDEVLESLGEAGLAEFRAIAAAMARIEAGTYGTCVTCGKAIREERLDVLPHTPFCAECARKTA